MKDYHLIYFRQICDSPKSSLASNHADHYPIVYFLLDITYPIYRASLAAPYIGAYVQNVANDESDEISLPNTDKNNMGILTSTLKQDLMRVVPGSLFKRFLLSLDIDDDSNKWFAVVANWVLLSACRDKCNVSCIYCVDIAYCMLLTYP